MKARHSFFFYFFFFCFWLQGLGATIWVAPELPSYALSKECSRPYPKDWEARPFLVSTSLETLASKTFDLWAQELAEARFLTLVCLRSKLVGDDQKRDFVQDWRTSLQRERILEKAEGRMFVSKDRKFPFSPTEVNLLKEYWKEREELQNSIQEISEMSLLMPSREWEKNQTDLKLQLKARYGSLQRIWETFILSLGPESRDSYEKEIFFRK